LRIISFEQIRRLNVSPEMTIDWVYEALALKDQSILPPKISIKFNDGCFFNTMPSLIPGMQRFGVKVVSRYPEAGMPDHRAPSITGDIMLYDTNTGRLLALVDGTWITAMRTGAVAAITCGILRKKNSAQVSFIGLGNTARAVLLCLNAFLKNAPLEVALLRYKKQHENFIARFTSCSNIKFTVYNDVNTLIQASRILVSCVTVMKHDFASDAVYPPGILVVPVHTMGFQNCDLFFDKIFCDDIGHIKDFKYFSRYKNCDEIANVIAGRNPGRENDMERILVYNIGIALHDLLFASKIYDLCVSSTQAQAEQDVSLLPPNLEKFWV